MKLFAYHLWFALIITCSCSYQSHEPSYEGETHWLKTCEDGSACGDQGTCICGVCTTSCQQDSECKKHDEAAVCANSISTSLVDGCSGEDVSLTTNLCILPCERNADCSMDDAELVCASDLCVDQEHQLATQKPDQKPDGVCPYNPDFLCTDEKPSDIIEDDAYLDENGCLLRQCAKDGDCLAGEHCYISANYGDCYFPAWSCEDYEVGEGCGCAIIDYEIPVVCEIGYCTTPEPITRCADAINSDAIDVIDAYIEGDVVTLTVGHSGGCAKHEYELCNNGNFDESYPVQTGLEFIHDANGDGCQAYVTEVLHFDLTPLKATYQQAYDTESGVIQTNFGYYNFGSLNCEEGRLVAGERIRQAELQADISCDTDDDCLLIDKSIPDCFPSCDTIVSKDAEAYFENRMSIIEENVCGHVESDNCALQAPSCQPPTPLACVNGQCTSEGATESNAPRQISTIGDPGPDMVTLFLYVSNQSTYFDTVDIAVSIDGEDVIEGDFPVGNQHNYYEFEFYLTPGEHTATLATTSLIELESLQSTILFKLESDQYWAVISFWADPDENERGDFTWDMQDTPISFM